ncbi:MAG: hypothetical protein HND57_15830 [Planctomycetes bacterium]|nr:hypothetical protein [Planctomycetota bacterium]
MVSLSSPSSSRRRTGVALLDVLVAGVLVAVALVAILGIASQSLRAQLRGEKLQQAAMLLDELLGEVLSVGVEEYENLFASEGTRPGYEGFEYQVGFEEAGTGRAYRVTATVWWYEAGTRNEETVQTLIAPRLGEEEIGDREPEEPIDREQFMP